MRKIFIQLILFFLISDSIAQTITLSQSRSANFKERAKESTKNYYTEIAELFGTTNSADDKDTYANIIKEESFAKPDVRIESDIKSFAQPDYDITQYLGNIIQEFSKQDANLSVKSINISDVYYNNSEQYYFIIAMVERVITINKNNKKRTVEIDNKIIDILFKAKTPDNVPKIFSVQNHKESILASLTPVKLISNEEAEKSLATNKPYLIFNITPIDAKIEIDGIPIEYSNGIKFETTPGKHKVQITSPRHQSMLLAVTSESKGTQSVTKSLKQVMGTLNIKPIESTMDSAEVYIDNKLVGLLPLMDYKLTVGTHKITVKKSEFFPHNEKISVVEDNPTLVYIKLISDGGLKSTGKAFGQLALLYGGYLALFAVIAGGLYLIKLIPH